MGKTLIIAEKPSVAKDIAAVLSVSRSGEYYENNELIISNCIGHLVEINRMLKNPGHIIHMV
jgi:DNA topoisomerase-3